ncbi:MAG: MIP/aquaporin family protein [Planctomycetaceae bacterium]
MNDILAEVLGTALLVLLGNGVVANVLLGRTKGHASGWIVITAGWAFAVYTAVLCVGQFSGAHINPAVTLGLATAGRFAWEQVPGFVGAQMLGGVMGAALVYLVYRGHYQITDDADAKLGTFCTAPAIRSWPDNLFSEVIGTMVLVLAVLLMVETTWTLDSPPGEQTAVVGLGAVGALRVGFIVLAIGLSLGGTTGYAINPARDLGPRLAHALLPIPGKRNSDWSYAWIPVVGPLAGGVLAALIGRAVSGP